MTGFCTRGSSRSSKRHPRTPQRVPRSPTLQRLGEEFQALYGARLEARGEAKMLLKILAARTLPVDEAALVRILACTDNVALEQWAEAALTATAMDEVFKE
ncbi:MAG: hypothetical protein HY909_09015 [Deltaproteobacteria bacterium]|nr:hypothetical protein [Deltaproteobacteria bacterium]